VNKPDKASIIGVSLILLFFVIDYYTKLYISKYLVLDRGIAVINGFFNIVNIHNPGIAFGVFSHLSRTLRLLLFSGISFVVLIGVLYLIMFGKDRDLFFIIGLSFLGGGDLGNLYERVVKGYVVDFLDFHLQQYHYPAFNLADSFITIGLFILISYKLIKSRKAKRTFDQLS